MIEPKKWRRWESNPRKVPTEARAAPQAQHSRTRKGCKCAGPCFYCGTALAGGHEHDHFPVPWRHGGRSTVPACLNCHDLKDRIRVTDWPALSFVAAARDLPHTATLAVLMLLGGIPLGNDGPALLTSLACDCGGREARIAFAKFVAAALDEAEAA